MYGCRDARVNWELELARVMMQLEFELGNVHLVCSGACLTHVSHGDRMVTALCVWDYHSVRARSINDYTLVGLAEGQCAGIHIDFFLRLPHLL